MASDVRKVEEFFQNIKTLSASFYQQCKGKEKKGSLAFERPHNVKIDFEDQKIPLIICKDDRCTFYNRVYGNKRVAPLKKYPWIEFLLEENKRLQFKEVLCAESLSTERCFQPESSDAFQVVMSNGQLVGFYINNGSSSVMVRIYHLKVNGVLSEGAFSPPDLSVIKLCA